MIAGRTASPPARTLVVLLPQTVQTTQSAWDNARDWVSALGSLGAALFAAIAFFWSLRGRRDRAWAELSHQARRVAVWVDTVKRQGPHASPGAGITWPVPAVIIQNNSEEPVHDCVVRIDIAREHQEEAGLNHFVLRRQIVPPGRTEIDDLGIARRDQSRLPVIWFTDSANVRWMRSHTGRLAREMSAPEVDRALKSRWQRMLLVLRRWAAEANPRFQQRRRNLKRFLAGRQAR
jgi:hypothetical protein